MNALLQQTKSAVLKKADPRLVPTINKTVAAGVKILNAPQTQQMIKAQLGNGDDPETIGAGIAKVAGMLYNQSHNQLPPQILMPAAAVLLCVGLEALEEAGTIKVDNNTLAACTKAMGSSLAQLFGATPDKLQGMVNQSRATGASSGASGATTGQPAPALGSPGQPGQPGQVVGQPAGVVAGAQGAM